MTAMLIVLRTFTEIWSIKPLFDVAPVSEDERLASEWSLIFGPSQSGLGFPVVAHIDAQCTTTSSMLVRFVGALSDAACLDLSAMLRAYALSDDSVIELKIGRRGDVRIRFHPEWDEFARELVTLCQAFAAPSERERTRSAEALLDIDVPEADDARLLAVASGALDGATDTRFTTWKYRPTAPFLYSAVAPTADAPPKRIGEVLVVYYSRSCERKGKEDPSLDHSTFNRLIPYLDLPSDKLFASDPGRVRAVLCKLAGQEPEFTELKVIMEAVRCLKMSQNKNARPDRLAARRPYSD
ncbi:hypothetical protein BH09GEM1_BH09GEM1_22680 [soil metagenome]